MNPDTGTALNYLNSRQSEGLLPVELEFCRKLLSVQAAIEQELTSLISPEVASDHSDGRPLLTPEEVLGNWKILERSFLEVKAVFASSTEINSQAIKALSGPESDRLFTRETARAWFEHSGLPRDTGAIEPALLHVIMLAAFRPLLSVYSRLLMPGVKQDQWRRNYCPVCGGRPDIAFLSKENGARLLVCARCDGQWLFQRLQCPACGTADQKSLSYFSDDTGRYRLYICEECKRYLKALDLRQGTEEVPVPVERFLTLDLDAQACRMGYSPITLP